MDKRFKKVNYNRKLNSSGQIKDLLKDIIKIIRYYQDRTKIQKDLSYKMTNRHNRFKAVEYIESLKSDLNLWWSIYRFRKDYTEKKRG